MLLPRSLIARLARAPLESRIGFLLHALSTGVVLTGLLLVAVRMMPPWWVPYLFLGLWLVAVAWRAPSSLRSQHWIPCRRTGWVPLVLPLPLGLWSGLLAARYRQQQESTTMD
jgi:hypothetical protein